MSKEVVFRHDYKNGDGFAVSVGKAPHEAIEADVICLHTAKGEKGTNQYYTPDEAMSVAIGLITGVDAVLGLKFYNEFRDQAVIMKPRHMGETASREREAREVKECCEKCQTVNDVYEECCWNTACTCHRT